MLTSPAAVYRRPHQYRVSLAVLSMLLLLSLLMQQLPISPPIPFEPTMPLEQPQNLPVTPAAPAFALPAQLAGQPELTDLRTMHSSTFDMGGGNYAVLQEFTPIHYRDENGEWQPINPAFAAVPNGWINRTNTVVTGLNQRSSAAKITAAGAGVGWEPQVLALNGAAGERTIAVPLPNREAAPGIRSADGSTLRYPNNWSMAGIQDQWQAAYGSSEYSMRLAQLPIVPGAAPDALDLVVYLHLLPGTTLMVDGQPAQLPLETGKPLEFVNAHGEPLVLMPPFAYEQGDRDTVTPGSYLVQAADDPQTLKLRVRTPWNWLSAPERQFPVIIDPLFQIRAPASSASAIYNWIPPTRTQAEFLRVMEFFNSDMAIRRNTEFSTRLLVKFKMPVMPLPGFGTKLDRAYLIAVPSGSEPSAGYAYSVRAHVLTNDWMSNQMTEPTFEADELPIIGSETMGFSAGKTKQTGMIWDISTPARTWLSQIDINSANNGVMLRLLNDLSSSSAPGSCLAFNSCGGFSFNPKPDSWSDSELKFTEENSSLNNPAVEPSERGGIRAIFYYTGPNLAEGTTMTMDNVGSSNVPPGSQAPSLFYHADHLYNLPPIPSDRWQAIVVRGFGPAVGVNPPILPGQNWTRPLAGSLSLDLRDAADQESFNSVKAPAGQVGYIIRNGYGQSDAPGAMLLRVGAPGTPTPEGYDVRLIRDRNPGSFVMSGANEGIPQTRTFTHSSNSPLSLWDMQFSPGGYSAVYVTVQQNMTNAPAGVINKFHAQLVHSSMRSETIASLGGAEERGPVNLNMIDGVGTNAFLVEPGQRYALALAYHGPNFYTADPPPVPESTDVTPAEADPNEPPTEAGGPYQLSFTVKITAISCGAGKLPTPGGTCQPVQCPNVNSDAQYREAEGIGLWSPSGWTGNAQAGSSYLNDPEEDPAPWAGPVRTNQPNQPTMLVTGGQFVFNKNVNPNTVNVTENSWVFLASCTSNSLSSAFLVYEGAMARADRTVTLQGFPPVTFSVLRPNVIPNTRSDIKVDPWPVLDRVDLTSRVFEVRPTSGQALGEERVRRRLTVPNTYDHAFDTSWWFNVQGWPSLGSTVKARTGNPTPPKIASLNLFVGGPANQFQMDVPPPAGLSGTRLFEAIRARQATVTQDENFGGASKAVQILILGRDRVADIQAAPQACSNASCIDIRAPSDTRAQPNRQWSMPDIHSNVKAGTVQMNAPGQTLIFSSDHPYSNSLQESGFDQEFSFDAYKATVSVQQEMCVSDPESPDYNPNAPIVTVVKGETRITLPNMGDSGNPDGQINATFKLCTISGDPSLRSVSLQFSSPVGIPIGSTGMFLTGLGGSIEIFPSYTQVRLNVQFQAAQGGDGGIFRATGEVLIDTRGLFEFQGNATILGVVDANGRVWVAWNPLDTGFDVSIHVGDWLSGRAYMHVWQGRGWGGKYSWLPNNKDMHFAGQIQATLTIEAGAVIDWWEIQVPPSDIEIGLELAFGEFCTNNSCTQYEWGIKGKVVLLGYDVGVYYGFEEGLDFILGNDDHILIDQYGGANAALTNGLMAPGQAQLSAAPQAIGGMALQPLQIDPETEQFLVSLGWMAGNPKLTLIAPDGVEVTSANAAGYGAEFLQRASSTMIGVKNPQDGQWQAKISNLSEGGIENYKFMFLANRGAPGAQIGTPEAVTTRLLTPTNPNEPAGATYVISWAVPPDADPSHTISLYYARTEVITGNLHIGTPIVKHEPYTNGSYVWNTVGVLNGSYQIYAVVDDGQNRLPTGEISIPDDACIPLHGPLPRERAFDNTRFPGTETFTATGTVLINDTTAPAAMTAPDLTVSEGAILVKWNAANGGDIAGYTVKWGPRGPGNTYIGEHEQYVSAQSSPGLRIGAVDEGKEYGVSIAAVDVNGNTGPFTAVKFATVTSGGTPIPLAPVNLARSGGDSTSVTVNWAAAPGPQPTQYRVTYTRVDLSPAEVGTLTVNGVSAQINGLVTGATYDIVVAAGNSAGWFSASSMPLRVVISNGVDANGDGLPDDWAAARGLNNIASPTEAGTSDSDGDGATNAGEFAAGTDPLTQDSDGDGMSDTEEQADQTDPLKGSNFGIGYRQPRLLVEKDTLTFRIKPIGTQMPSAPAASSLTWANIGGGTLQLQASSSANWLKPSVTGNTLQIAVDATGLQPGFYSGVVRLNQAGSDPLIGQPQCVRVKTWVYPPSEPQTRVFIPVVVR